MFHTDKLTAVNKQFYVGIAGYARYGDIIQYADVERIHPAELAAETFDARGWLITNAIPDWVAALKNAEHIHKDKDDWANGSILVILAGRIFEIGHDFSVTEHLEYGGIGSGSNYAIGAMAAGKTAEKALEIASVLDPYTGGQLNVLKGVQ